MGAGRNPGPRPGVARPRVPIGHAWRVDASNLLAAVEALITSATATEISSAYGDLPVYPDETVVENPDSPVRYFPDWPGHVLLLSHENQGVCSWGVSLDGDLAGSVLVGGDLGEGRGTVVYASGVDQFVALRRWDRQCLEREPLLQAQAAPLDDASLAYLRSACTENVQTFGWPCDINYRFAAGSVRIMLWSCPDQCDWWISGQADEIAALLTNLRTLSDLGSSLWSDDPVGSGLLSSHTPEEDAGNDTGSAGT